MDNVAKEIITSSEGLEKLKKELNELKTVRRPEIAEKIETARAFGDLSENSEYDAAKNEQAQVEGRIAELEEQIKYARVLDETELINEVVHVGSRVTVQVPRTPFVAMSAAERNVPSTNCNRQRPCSPSVHTAASVADTMKTVKLPMRTLAFMFSFPTFFFVLIKTSKVVPLYTSPCL